MAKVTKLKTAAAEAAPVANEEHPRLYIREDGKRVIESTYRGQPTRFVEGRDSFLEVPVDGTPIWRAAQWEDTERGRLYSKYGSKTNFEPELRPIIDEKKEVLRETADGRFFISTI